MLQTLLQEFVPLGSTHVCAPVVDDSRVAAWAVVEDDQSGGASDVIVTWVKSQ